MTGNDGFEVRTMALKKGTVVACHWIYRLAECVSVCEYQNKL